MPIRSYISFGSNVGDLKKNLCCAEKALNNTPNVTLMRTSPLYLTEPHTIDGTPQAWYLNCVLEIETTLDMQILHQTLKQIEKDLGRDLSNPKWSPRLVDLDLLFFGDAIYESEQLCVPHREIAQRLFVLKPLCDLVPDYVHPVLGLTVREMLEKCTDRHEIKIF